MIDPGMSQGGSGWLGRLRRWREQVWFGSIAAALAMAFVEAVFWQSPVPYKALESLPNEQAAGRALRAEFPSAGAYMIPRPGAEDRQRADLLEVGPPAVIYIQYDGGPPWWRSLIWAAIFNFVIAYTIGTAMRRFSGGLSPPRRLSLLTLIGLAVALFSSVSDPISWERPLFWHVVVISHTLIAWLAGSIVLAFFVIDPRAKDSVGTVTPRS